MDTIQLKITLPIALYDYLESKAQRFGLAMATYIKHLVIKDVEDMDIPTFPMSPKTEAVALKALKDYRAGRVKEVKSIDELLNSI
jgi:predicted DNA-binding protein